MIPAWKKIIENKDHIIIGIPSFIILDGSILIFSLRLEEPIIYKAETMRVILIAISACGHNEIEISPIPRGILWIFRYSGDARRIKEVGWGVAVMKGMMRLKTHRNAERGVNYSPLMTDLRLSMSCLFFVYDCICLWVCITIIFIQIEMRIKGRPSLKKLDKEKPMNMTMASAIFSSKDIR